MKKKCTIVNENTTNFVLLVKVKIIIVETIYCVCLPMKGKIDVDSLWNAVIERMIDLKAIPYDIPPFAMYFRFQILTFRQNKLLK
jgi:hypothetical protein